MAKSPDLRVCFPNLGTEEEDGILSIWFSRALTSRSIHMCSFTTAHHIVFEAGDSRFLRILVTALEPGYDGIISHVLETRKSLVIYYNPFLLHRAELKKLVRAVFHDTESHGLRIVETQDRTIRRRRG